MWNYWLWEGSWRVLASYHTREEAIDAVRNSGDSDDVAFVCKANSPRDNFIRQHCTKRYATSGSNS